MPKKDRYRVFWCCVLILITGCLVATCIVTMPGCSLFRLSAMTLPPVPVPAPGPPPPAMEPGGLPLGWWREMGSMGVGLLALGYGGHRYRRKLLNTEVPKA